MFRRTKYGRLVFYWDKHEFLSEFKKIGKYAVFFSIILLYWEFITYLVINKTLYGFSVFMPLLILPIGLCLGMISGWSRKSKTNKRVTVLVTALLTVFYLSELIYFRTFGSIISLSMIGMGGDAITNFWWALWVSIKTSVWFILIYLVPLIAAIIVSLTRKVKQMKIMNAWHVFGFIIAVVAWISTILIMPVGGTEDHTAYGAYHSSFVDSDTAARKLGVLANTFIEVRSMVFGGSSEADFNIDTSGSDILDDPEPEVVVDTSPHMDPLIDFDKISNEADNKQVTELCEYMKSAKVTNKNEYTGMFEGYNLVYICAESFSSMAIDRNVTPTLYKLAHEGIILNNYYNSYKNTTTNGEYSFLAGIWPDVSRDAKMGTNVGNMAQSAKKCMQPSLGNMFKTIGVQARGYHNYVGSYYYRDESWPNMGFECKFMNQGMKFTTTWPSSDYEMMEQSVDDYINDEQFCAYYMTFSGHGPYSEENGMYNRNIEWVREALKYDTRKLSDTAKGYLAVNRELDKALEYLLNKLEAAGKLNNTVIVMTGDHYPYYVDDKDRNALSGHVVDEEFELYKSTCIMWVGGLEEPIQCDEYCCNVDILPTILNLFNIDYDSRMYAGTDIFSTGNHMAVLYNRNFITDKVKYVNSSGEAEWFVDQSAYNEKDLEIYLNSMINTVKKKYSASLMIADTDFYSYIWKQQAQ